MNFCSTKSFIFFQKHIIKIKINGDLFQIKICYYLKLRIPIKHCQYFKIKSQNPENFSRFCNARNNLLQFASRKWFADNQSQKNGRYVIIHYIQNNLMYIYNFNFHF